MLLTNKSFNIIREIKTCVINRSFTNGTEYTELCKPTCRAVKNTLELIQNYNFTRQSDN